MKRRANQLDWGTPQTKRSFAAESVVSTQQDPFQEYIASNYNGIRTYKLGHINSIYISSNPLIKKITKFIIFFRILYIKEFFVVIVLNHFVRPSIVNALGMDRSVVKSVIVKIVITNV